MVIHHIKRNLTILSVVFVVWLAVFIIAFSITDINEALSSLFNLNFTYLSLALGCFVLSLLVSGINWNLLIRFMGKKVHFLSTFQIMLAGYSIDNILPNIAPGGELSMAYLLHGREKIKIEKAFSSVIFQMIGWFIGFIIFSSIVILMLVFMSQISAEIAFILGVLLGCFVFILLLIWYLIVNPKPTERFIIGIIDFVFKIFLNFTRMKKMKSTIVSSAKKDIESFSRTFRKQKMKKLLVAFSSSMMFLHYLLYALSFYFILLAFNIEITLITAFGIFIMVNLISLLSMIPGQFGVYELVSIPLISLSAGFVNSALVIGVIRLIHYWSITFIGGFFAIKLSLEEISK